MVQDSPLALYIVIYTEVMHSEEVLVKEEVDGAVHGNVADSAELVDDDDDERMCFNVA